MERRVNRASRVVWVSARPVSPPRLPRFPLRSCAGLTPEPMAGWVSPKGCSGKFRQTRGPGEPRRTFFPGRREPAHPRGRSPSFPSRHRRVGGPRGSKPWNCVSLSGGREPVIWVYISEKSLPAPPKRSGLRGQCELVKRGCRLGEPGSAPPPPGGGSSPWFSRWSPRGGPQGPAWSPVPEKRVPAGFAFDHYDNALSNRPRGEGNPATLGINQVKTLPFVGVICSPEHT